MNNLTFRDPSYFARPVSGGVIATKAGMTTSPVITTGAVNIDQSAVVSKNRFQGVQVSVPFTLENGTVTATAGARTYTVAMQLKSSTASGGTYTNFASGSQTFANTAVASGVDEHFCAFLAGNLVSANHWVRATVTFTGSTPATSADSAATSFVYTFFGPDRSPASGLV